MFEGEIRAQGSADSFTRRHQCSPWPAVPVRREVGGEFLCRVDGVGVGPVGAESVPIVCPHRRVLFTHIRFEF
jgi:hypothetical protein